MTSSTPSTEYADRRRNSAAASSSRSFPPFCANHCILYAEVYKRNDYLDWLPLCDQLLRTCAKHWSRRTSPSVCHHVHGTIRGAQGTLEAGAHSGGVVYLQSLNMRISNEQHIWCIW